MAAHKVSNQEQSHWHDTLIETAFHRLARSLPYSAPQHASQHSMPPLQSLTPAPVTSLSHNAHEWSPCPFTGTHLIRPSAPLVGSTCRAGLQPRRASNQAHGVRSPGPRDAPYATTDVEPVTASASTPGISVVTSLDFSCVATSSMAELSDAILSARSCAEANCIVCLPQDLASCHTPHCKTLEQTSHRNALRGWGWVKV